MSTRLPVASAIEFTIPGIPLSLNEWSRRHWRVRHGETKRWRDLVALFAPKRLIRGPVIVTLTFHSHRDADNMAKCVVDGLVGRVIEDDRPSILTELRLRSRPGEARTEVRVEVA